MNKFPFYKDFLGAPWACLLPCVQARGRVRGVSTGGRAHGPLGSRALPAVYINVCECASSLLSGPAYHRRACVRSAHPDSSGSGCQLLLWTSGLCQTFPGGVWVSQGNPRAPSAHRASCVTTGPCPCILFFVAVPNPPSSCVFCPWSH